MLRNLLLNLKFICDEDGCFDKPFPNHEDTEAWVAITNKIGKDVTLNDYMGEEHHVGNFINGKYFYYVSNDTTEEMQKGIVDSKEVFITRGDTFDFYFVDTVKELHDIVLKMYGSWDGIIDTIKEVVSDEDMVLFLMTS